MANTRSSIGNFNLAGALPITTAARELPVQSTPQAIEVNARVSNIDTKHKHPLT